ncbi:MAG: hypothetical protein Q9159_006071 [Coniocarpon cinnabarinum]
MSETYDYVVVGGGTAGLTIANRLAANHSVAVVEAGSLYQITNNNHSTIPGYAILNSFLSTSPQGPSQPLVDWRFLTEPIPGIDNQQIHYVRGKALGGSSAVNGMAYHRASAGTYQRWADVAGDQTYALPNFLHYFQRSVDFSPPNTEARLENASVAYDPTAFDNSLGGTLHVGYPNWVDPYLTWLGRGMAALGITESKVGFNTGILSGFSSYVTSTINNPDGALRASSQTAFLSPDRCQMNLQVYPQTLAKRITFDDNKAANSVVISTDGFDYALSASKEVIVSAGVIQSPQLLMVSGVGPKDTLDQFDIPIVQELPGVGQNLWDQQAFAITNEVNLPTEGELLEPSNLPATEAEYHANGTGPLSSVDGYIGFEKFNQDVLSNLSPDTQSALQAFPEDWPEIEYLNGATQFKNGSNFAGISAALVAPLSRGYVSIRSNTMLDPPVIQPGWFADQRDREVAILAFRRLRQIWGAISDVTVGPEAMPGANVTSDDAIFEYIKSSSVSMWHSSATCAMGMQNDTNAVVDAKGSVFGVKNLRVVDISAFPFALPGHPQASVYALAEKIAEDVLEGA